MEEHQTRMKRYTQIIYMLSQSKDAIDNPAALFAANYAVWIGRLTRDSRCASWKILTGGYSHRVNQSGVCCSSDVIMSGGRKSETTMEDKWIVVVCGYPELYINHRIFTKTGIHFATRLELPGRSHSHDANLRLLCSEFHVRMKRISCANEANFTREWSE